MRKIKYLILHHTVSHKNTTILEIANWHKERFYKDYKRVGVSEDTLRGMPLLDFIQYHYIINGLGKVFDTRPEDKIGWHCSHYNQDSIGIALCGNFETENPTQNQMDSLQSLLLELLDRYDLTPESVVLHRNLGQTLCPGKNLIERLPDALKLIRLRIQRKKEYLASMKETGCKLWNLIKMILRRLHIIR